MKVIIRKIKHSDYLGIIDLYNQYYKKNIMYHDVNMSDTKIIIVAEIDNKIIAFSEINIINNEIENYKYSYITNICISKEHQSESIITLLNQAFEKISKQQKCKKILLNIPSNQHFETYKKLNYKGTNNVILTKDLE